MSLMFCCLRNCFDGLGFSEQHVMRRELNPVVLDTAYMGQSWVMFFVISKRVTLKAKLFGDRCCDMLTNMNFLA